MTIHLNRLVLPLSALAVLAGAGEAGAQRAERFELRGERVAVHNLIGEVRVEAGSGGAVVVEVVRGGRQGGELRVERGTTDGAQALRVIYNGDRFVYPRMGRGARSQISMNRDGTFGDGGWSLRRRRVTVTGAGNGTEAYADLRVLVPAGRTVAVHQGVGEVTVGNVDGQLTVKTASAGVRATGTRGSLSVDVGSGRVALTGVQGLVDVDTGSGDVTVSRFNGNRLNVDTGSGGVTGSDVAAGVLSVDVGSGGVRLTGVRSHDVEIDTGSGSVELGMTSDAERVDIDTGSGGVTLTLPPRFGAAVEVDTGSGGISVDVPLSARRGERSHLTGTLGDGRGRVTIDTGSGGVRIRGS